ncbi:Flagellar biosynthetic protein FliP precursor [Roseimaritima multifibrata]|uniref:Flagellar biosynthetic protein FliP n=2 Tax=Roseimaritima multifibrata TaxID=1930274 RepID=A0A517MLJ6_9BACT|nr:Flagellar biosynthetic protein FliP precursor [Roseimaritima multifibrata]
MAVRQIQQISISLMTKLAIALVIVCGGMPSVAGQETLLPEQAVEMSEPTLLTAEDMGRPVLDSPLDFVAGGPERWTSPEGLSSSLQIMLLLTVVSLAPALLLMTTCYVRIIVVLGLLRQAIGLQSLPPSQVMTSIALFMTLFVMTPVWKQVYNDAIVPYTDPEISMDSTEAWEKGVQPIRDFMARQIDVAENHDDVLLFYRYVDPNGAEPENWEMIPLQALLPAYMLSELKTSFLMGFQIYLPFLIVDLVVASVTISMGMLMLPPAVISLPFKLLLFVLVDGWHLVVKMLMDSFGTFEIVETVTAIAT